MQIDTAPYFNLFVSNQSKTYINPLSIKGQIKKIGVAFPCWVRLFEKQSGRLVDQRLTDKFGHFQFDSLSQLAFFIVAHDPASQFNAVIQDNVVPK